MRFPKSPRPEPVRSARSALLAVLAACGATAGAATITPGDVSAALGPTFFVDEAATGGRLFLRIEATEN